MPRPLGRHFESRAGLRRVNNSPQPSVTFITQGEGIIASLLGSLRSHDGNCKENVTLKLNFALSWVSCDYSMLITLCKIGGVHFRLLGTDGVHLKANNERFSPASSRCRQNLKYENFTSSFGRQQGVYANTTSTAARTSSENVTSLFRSHFWIIQSHHGCKVCSNYPGIKLEPALQR